jgi:hypothetical protein
MNVTKTERDYSQEQPRVKIAVNKSLLKEFHKDNERVVYLEDEDEFQIQIFNDQTTEIGARIFVNDEPIGNSYLVIKPGERVWLDRYLDKALKFKFKTYEVNGNSRDVQRAIRNNGIVKVMLYRKNSTYTTTYIEDLTNILQDTIQQWPYHMDPEPYWSPKIYYCNNTLSLDDSVRCSTTAGSGFVTANYCNTTNYNEPTQMKATLGSTKSFNSNKVETGRISEGGHSDQKFDYVNMSFDSFAFATETIHILPKSTKPVQSSDLQKVYCTNCGRKIKSKFKYCPYCGNEIE